MVDTEHAWDIVELSNRGKVQICLEGDIRYSAHLHARKTIDTLPWLKDVLLPRNPLAGHTSTLGGG